MSIANIRPGWHVRFSLQNHHIDSDLTPPKSIDELIEAPSTTQLNSCELGYPTEEAAIEALRMMVAFEVKHGDLLRNAYKREPNVTVRIQNYLDRRDGYLNAVVHILEQTE